MAKTVDEPVKVDMRLEIVSARDVNNKFRREMQTAVSSRRKTF